MPEPREPITPPEPACDCHGWPGSVCDARQAATTALFGRVFYLVLALAAALNVAVGFLGQPSGTNVLGAALCSLSVGAAIGGWVERRKRGVRGQ